MSYTTYRLVYNIEKHRKHKKPNMLTLFTKTKSY